MINFSAVPFVRIFLACSLGIVFQEFVFPEVRLPVPWLLFCAAITLVLWLISSRASAQLLRTAVGLSFLMCVAAAGMYRKQMERVSARPNHLVNFSDTIDFYKCVLEEDPIEKTNTWAFDTKLMSVRSGDTIIRAEGKLQVYLRKDTLGAGLIDSLMYGSVIWIKGAPETIRPLRNPGGFDFKKYMARKGFHFQDYVTAKDIKIAEPSPPNPVIALSIGLRRELLRVLKLYLPDVRQRSIAEALILGKKDEIDIEQRRSYAAAGAMHILAVSGLHVGIIYMILGFLLKPLERRTFGKYLRLIMLFVGLWAFAFVTGLSASVLRAVTMFSIVLIAESTGRKSNIYNTLALAAFLLLLYNPNFLFDVGFQLSFLAVLGIVYLQPRLYGLWEAPNRLTDWAWSITCVSVAAQLATGPLSIFYFNQFPTWFLVANLLVIPGAFVILTAGIGLFVIHYLSPFLASWFALLAGGLIGSLNWFVEFIEQLPASLIFPISFSAFQTWVLYLMMFAVLAWWYSKKYRWFVLASMALLVFVASRLSFLYEKHQTKELVIYEMTGFTALDYQVGGKVYHYYDEGFKKEERFYNLNVRPHLIQQGTVGPLTSHAGNWLPRKVLVPDTLVAFLAGDLQVLHLMKPLPRNRTLSEQLKADLIVVSNNSLQVGRTDGYFSAGEYVFDGTNRFSYLNRTVKSLTEKEQKVYVIPWEGAYIRNMAE